MPAGVVSVLYAREHSGRRERDSRQRRHDAESNPNPDRKGGAGIMAASTTANSELTQEQVSTTLIQPLEQASIFLAAGPRIFDTAGGNTLRIPTMPTLVDPDDGEPFVHTWTGENGLIPEADIATDELVLLPSTMKSIKTITRYSNELARQSVVALDAAIQARMVADVAGAVDARLFSASGDGVTEPQGLFAWTGTQSITSVGELTLDALLTAQGLALAANVSLDNLRVFVRPEDYMQLRKLKDGNDRYLLQPDATAAGGYSALGMPIGVSGRIPVGSAAVADVSQIAVARDVMPSVKVLTERYADYDQQAIRVVSRFDAAPMQPAAVVKLTGITQPAAE